MPKKRKVFITGGAGYVGANLVPKLLEIGHEVTVIDLYLYGEDVLNSVKNHSRLTQVKGDIRNRTLLEKHIKGCDALIHLACISNDPSYELNPNLGKSINFDAFFDLVDIAKNLKVKNFIYASSSSVYGIKTEEQVTEDLPLEPLTDYSKYKAECEQVLLKEATNDFIVTIIRPSTVCGYSPRLRLDLTVNILTNHAINKGEITVFGGEQKRPNIHIDDMTDLYAKLLQLPDKKIQKKIWNAGFENFKVKEIAEIVRTTIDPSIPVNTVSSDDNRSYHVSSEKIRKDIGFIATRNIEQAVSDLKIAFDDGRIPNSMEEPRYFNIKLMQNLNIE